MTSKVIVVGNGGREHALGAGLNESPLVEAIYFVPGNAGTAQLSKGHNKTLSQAEIVLFAENENIDLVVIGPEAPLVAGLADDLRAAGITTFGPSKAAAQLEASKAFATAFMQSEEIPLPPSKIVTTNSAAHQAVSDFGGPGQSVIKADGLAGGKGVFLPDDEAATQQAIEDILQGKVDGSGKEMVIQKRYHGPEVSVFVLSDGTNFQIIPIACQDHKRLLEGDKGPNTGGMGAYAPLPAWMVNQEQWAAIAAIAEKSLTCMKRRQTPYQGVLYLGLMLAEELHGSPIVIEYNARFGDPETEVLIPLLKANGVDIYELLYATATSLSNFKLPQHITSAAVTICLAAAGYPQAPQQGAVINGLTDLPKAVQVYHGGTQFTGKTVTASGGRVVYVTALASDVSAALATANQAIGESGVHFAGMQYRSDIGYRLLEGPAQQ